MKLAMITDIHHAPDGPSIIPHVETFVEAASRAGADLLLDLGDRIDDIDRQTDLRLLEELASVFRRFQAPRLHLLGNHDVVNLTGDDHQRLLGRRPDHCVYDLGAMRLLLWEPGVEFHRPRGFNPAGPQLDWLTTALAADPRPAIVASHIPLSGAAMTGNYYFSNNPGLATYPDHRAVRSAVEATGAAALWLSGHVHWNSFCKVGNLHHATIQSPSETFTTAPEPALCWALLTVEGEDAVLDIHGRDRLKVSFRFARSDTAPWPEPRPAIA